MRTKRELETENAQLVEALEGAFDALDNGAVDEARAVIAEALGLETDDSGDDEDAGEADKAK